MAAMHIYGNTFSTDMYHPAGDVLWILIEPGNLVPYISVAEHWSWLSGDKNR